MKLNEIDVTGYETILLDRDGTINVHIIGDYVCKWADFEFIPGVKDAIADFSKHARYIFIVTNQRGIGKGRYTDEVLHDIHNNMVNEIEKAGGRIDGIYYSSALTEEDIRRKPGRGMFDEILKDFPDVDPNTTIMIGDGDVDIAFAKNCNIKGIKIDSLKRNRDKYYWQYEE